MSKPTKADKRLAEEVLKLVSSWCGFYGANIEELEKLLSAARVRWQRPTKAMARALGRRGGLKGGPARAASMTSAERSEVAAKAAMARWKLRAEMPSPADGQARKTR